MIEHLTVPSTTPSGLTVDTDAELADLVELVWQTGCETIWCCQDHGEVVG